MIMTNRLLAKVREKVKGKREKGLTTFPLFPKVQKYIFARRLMSKDLPDYTNSDKLH
jgi:hypothetical protein